MGLRAKFNLAMLLAFAVGLVLAGILGYSILRENARQEVLQQAALMIANSTAARDYTAREIGPLLADQTKTRFLPQTIPFWAAQATFRDVHKQFPAYDYKEAVLNPTNPADRATDWQADIIDAFRNNPAKTELINERRTPAGPTLNFSRPIKVDDQSCLVCHSVPAAAPQSMVDLYGTANGFGWKLGTVIGAQIITVPMSVAYDRANQTFAVFMASLAAVFVVMMIIMNIILHVAIIRPIRRIAAVAGDISLGNMEAPELVPRGRDEVAQLTEAFNRMRRSLANAMRMLAD